MQRQNKKKISKKSSFTSTVFQIVETVGPGYRKISVSNMKPNLTHP